MRLSVRKLVVDDDALNRLVANHVLPIASLSAFRRGALVTATMGTIGAIRSGEQFHQTR